MSDLLFAPKIDMWSINPYNVKLGNEYLDSLITTALAVIPKLYQTIGDDLIVKQAFTPAGKVKEDKGDDANSYDRKYSLGLALSFTWNGFNEADAVRIAMDLMDNFNEGDRGLHIVVNPLPSELSLSVYRKMKDKKLYNVVGIDKETNKFKRKTIKTYL